ncbi:alpha/beta fold hydrolase [Clostridium sp. 'deep sea']|uniref:alpha/beta fold hydrolase n=1 Tax=Clostridium sp. 'deep sea' TaxID=2779445 RepID=UPI00189686BA|nr:alpha/beta fold hydrolase [Clostridium sp. 'deep sea']QOR36214.1 alpha/beta fold hydrolase [Clostridium sp. 'deep sea']
MNQDKKIIGFENYIKIGGVNQYIQAKGCYDNEILFYLHGGPAIPASPVADIFQKQLQKHFIVVNWDQRGCGNSYSKNIKEENFTIQQLLQDANEVINYVLSKFNKQKIFLVAQSFGSVLGLKLAKLYPQKIYAYISTSQVVNIMKNEAVTYQKSLSEALKQNNKEAIAELTSIGEPPYKNMINDISVQRKWLHKFGFIERKHCILETISQNTPPELFQNIIKSAELVGKQIFKDLITQNINFTKEIKSLDVPVIFCVGKYDYATPGCITKEFYQQLKAPQKQLIYFNESAHFPDYDEPRKFANILIKLLNNLKC